MIVYTAQQNDLFVLTQLQDLRVKRALGIAPELARLGDIRPRRTSPLSVPCTKSQLRGRGVCTTRMVDTPTRRPTPQRSWVFVGDRLAVSDTRRGKTATVGTRCC